MTNDNDEDEEILDHGTADIQLQSLKSMDEDDTLMDLPLHSEGADSSDTITSLIENENDSLPTETEDAMPWRVLILIYLVIFSEAAAINMSVPFLPHIIEHKFGVSKEQVGSVSGFIYGGFLLASFFSSFFIGSLSDRVGRRPLIVFGLCTSAISLFFFGIVETWEGALVLRIIGGLTNANIGLSFSVISDVTNSSNRSVAFAYVGAVFAIGRAISSVLGGVAFGNYIPFLPDTEMWGRNPYLLPVVIGSTINFISLVVFFKLFKETNLQGVRKHESLKRIISTGFQYMKRPENRIIFHLAVIYWVHSFCNGAILIVITLYFSLEIPLRGFSFPILHISYILLAFGVFGGVFQLSSIRSIISKYGTSKVYRAGATLLATSSLLFPVIGFLIHELSDFNNSTTLHNNLWIWLYITICVLILAIGFMMGLPVLSSIISSEIPQNRQGSLQGAYRAVASLLRSMGPIITGALFSIFTFSLALPSISFIILFCGYSFCAIRFSTMDWSILRGFTESVDFSDDTEADDR